MIKLLSILILASVVVDTFGQHIILPTYRPPRTRRPIIRKVRDTGDQEPLWLYKGDVPRAPATGDHPILPTYIDDVKVDPNRRYARNVNSLNARQLGGATHPGHHHHRRNARSAKTGFMQRPSINRPRPRPRPFPRQGPIRQTYPIYPSGGGRWNSQHGRTRY